MQVAGLGFKIEMSSSRNVGQNHHNLAVDTGSEA
jgi:hypothetical protein